VVTGCGPAIQNIVVNKVYYSLLSYVTPEPLGRVVNGRATRLLPPRPTGTAEALLDARLVDPPVTLASAVALEGARSLGGGFAPLVDARALGDVEDELIDHFPMTFIFTHMRVPGLWGGATK
jgi:hypothetical protein